MTDTISPQPHDELQKRIAIPRLDGEPQRAYAARVAYLTLGRVRSYERVRQSIDIGSIRRIQLWASKYSWVEHARAYDTTLATLAAEHAATQYRAELDAYRARYAQTGKALHGVAAQLLAKLQKRVALIDPAVVSTKSLAGDLRAVSAAMTTAADLEAHALQLHELLPRLSAADVDED